MEMQPLIAANSVSHYYGRGTLRKRVLFDVSAEIMPGEIVLLTGPSGSGKTTLLTLAGALRSVQEGSMKVLNSELNGASSNSLMTIRENIGFIFQQHNLLDALTACQNVEMSMGLERSLSRKGSRQRAVELLTLVGLEDRVDYRPDQLSGGQRQRVAIARALVRRPKIILADEPTASLDRKSGREVVELLQDLARKQGCAILLVTHDNRILDIADRILTLEDGSIRSFAEGLAANTGHLLGAFAQLNQRGDLAKHVADLSNKQFIEMLEQMTSEFENFLKACELGNRDAVEALFDQVLSAVGEKVRLLLHADRCTIFLVDHARQKLRSKIATDEHGKPLTIEIPLGAGIAGLVARTGEASNISDPYSDPNFNPQVDRDTGYVTRNILCIPIFDRKKQIFAVAQLINKLDAPAFDAEDEKEFGEFSELFSVVVESCLRMQGRNTILPS
jgi:putative ABC transport system ATP-binding protein